MYRRNGRHDLDEEIAERVIGRKLGHLSEKGVPESRIHQRRGKNLGSCEAAQNCSAERQRETLAQP
jgi:hypothetical protein